MSVPSSFTPRALRDAFGRFATGVTVITTQAETGPMGITANSFTSVSLDPPLVLWLPAKSSSRFTPFTQCKTFAIHIMGSDQVKLCDHFVSQSELPADLQWTRAAQGTPLIEGCLARFHCETHAMHDAGDHAIVVGRVLDVQQAQGNPLVFAQGRYGSVSAPNSAPNSAPKSGPVPKG